MHKAIATRELMTLDGIGTRVRGTYHHPSSSRTGAGEGTGMLFLNSLSLPRTATGDSALHLADSFAARGYPSFRFDLPGLGDSDGEAPADLLEFINSGGYAAAAAAMTKELAGSMGLAGVVIVGHCAGCVSALYAAASKECKGLILMDPYFHLPHAKRPKLQEELSDWARRNSVGANISDIYDSLRNIALILRGNAPPSNANFRLLDCWKQVATSGLPILILKAPGLKSPGTKPRVGVFDYLKHVVDLAGRKGRVKIGLIEGTDHSFANIAGRKAVQQCIEDWLSSYFPLVSLEETGNRVSPEQRTNANGPAVSANLGRALEGQQSRL